MGKKWKRKERKGRNKMIEGKDNRRRGRGKT